MHAIYANGGDCLLRGMGQGADGGGGALILENPEMPPLIRFLVSGRRRKLAEIIATLGLACHIGWVWAKADQDTLG